MYRSSPPPGVSDSFRTFLSPRSPPHKKKKPNGQAPICLHANQGARTLSHRLVPSPALPPLVMQL